MIDMDLIDRKDILEALDELDISQTMSRYLYRKDLANVRLGISMAVDKVEALQTVDAEPVVYCKDCVLHGGCTFEDMFVGICHLEKAFCCVGKRKENKDIPICLTEDCPYQKGNPCEAWETCGGFEGDK